MELPPINSADFMKAMTLNVEFQVSGLWRLKLGTAVIKFAAWLMGFGGCNVTNMTPMILMPVKPLRPDQIECLKQLVQKSFTGPGKLVCLEPEMELYQLSGGEWKRVRENHADEDSPSRVDSQPV